MSKAVDYRGLLLMSGSRAYDLYHDHKDPESRKKLDQHLKEVEANNKALLAAAGLAERKAAP